MQEDPEMIQITIKTLENQDQVFSVEDETTVAQLKETIRDEMNIAIENQRLIFGGKILTDNVKLSESGVDGKVIHLVTRPPPSTLSRRYTAQGQQADAADNANRASERAANRSVDSPIPRVTFDPPSDAVLEQRHQASLTNVSGRTDFIGTAMAETSNSMDYLDYYAALGASTNVPVVRAEEEDSDSMDLQDLPEVSFVTKNTSRNTEPRPSTSAIEPQPSTSAQPAEVMRPQTQSETNTIPPVPYRRGPRPPTRPILATPADLANLFEELSELHARFEPHRATYCALLRDRSTALELPSLEVTRRQAFIEMAGDVLHGFAHIYHALSDLELNIGDYSTKLTTDTVADSNNSLQRYTFDVVTPAELQVGPVPHMALFRRANMPNFNPLSASTPTNARPHSANSSPQPATSADSITFHQVQASVPVRRVDTVLLQDMMANMQNALQQATNQQASQPDGGQGQNRAANQGQTGPNQGQTGQAQGDGNRPTVFMEIENLVRTLSQAHPGVDVVMSMEEVQPLGSPLNMGPPDIFPSDPQNEAFLFDMNASIPVIDSNNPSLSGSPTGGNEGGPNAGIRFVNPGVGGSPRFNIPGFAASLGFPDGSTGAPVGFSTTGPPGAGFSTIGAASFQLQPDGGVFVSPIPAGSRSDTIQEMINTVLRANSSSSSATPGTNTTANTTANTAANNTAANNTANTTSANQNNANTSTTTTSAANSAPIPNAMYTINPNVAVRTFTYRLTPDMGVVHQLNVGDAVPGMERSSSVGASRRTTNERRRTNREINRSPRLQSLNNLSNMRAHQRAQNMMLYDRFLMCNNVYSYERLSERRHAYQEQQSEQMEERLMRSSPTGIERLENSNYNFTTRHMACMMRLLSGPITPESRLNAFMVAVARKLYLDQQTRACSQHPPIAPLEFYFVRMHMRDYLQRIVNTVIDSGARENLFDQTAAIILSHSRTFINQMDQCTLLSTAAPPMHMLRVWLRFHIPELLACILSDLTSDTFVETFYSVVEHFYTDICAYTMSFCVNGFEGFRHLYTMYIEYLTENFEETSREWVRLVSRENLLAIQSLIDPMTPASFVYQRTRAQRQPSPHATPSPPPARNDTPDTEGSLPSVSTLSRPQPNEMRNPRRAHNFFDLFSPPSSPDLPGTTLRSLASDEYRSSPETRSIQSGDDDEIPSTQQSPASIYSSQESNNSVSFRELDSVIFPDSPPLSAPEVSRPTQSQDLTPPHSESAEAGATSPPILTQTLSSSSTPSQDLIRILTPPASGSAGPAANSPPVLTQSTELSQEIILISSGEMSDSSQPTQAGVAAGRTNEPRNSAATTASATNTNVVVDSSNSPEAENVAACSNSDVLQMTRPVRLQFDEQWLPVLNQDQRLQRLMRERPQEPFSDAYLLGMPARKRRRVRSARPPTTLDAFVSESFRATTEHLSALENAQIRSHLVDTVRTLVRERADASEDYNPVRFASTARFLEQTPQTSPIEEDPKTTEERME